MFGILGSELDNKLRRKIYPFADVERSRLFGRKIDSVTIVY
jgi:hypothetical protein